MFNNNKTHKNVDILVELISKLPKFKTFKKWANYIRYLARNVDKAVVLPFHKNEDY